MPANIRIRCKYIDCQFLDGLYCSKPDEIELDQKRGCLAYTPIQKDTPEEELGEYEETTEEEDEWMDLEDEEEEEDDEADARYDTYEE